MASSLSTPTPISVPFATSGSKNSIPIPSQIGTTDGAASYTDGFPPLTMTPLASGGKPPNGMDMNGILYEITNQLRYLCGGGRPRFSATLSSAIGGYPVGAILQDNSGANSYINVVDGNTTDFNSTPASIGVSWLPFGASSIGVGQSWQVLTGSRALGSTYTNNTGRPIMVNASLSDSNPLNGTTITFYIGGTLMGYGTTVNYASVALLSSVSFIAPPGQTYKVDQTSAGIGTLYFWSELR